MRSAPRSAVKALSRHQGQVEAGRDYYYDAEEDWDGEASYDVFSFGAIDAVIAAENPGQEERGGRVGSVAAWGPIGGIIRAGESIDYVRSGDAVTATLVAPRVGQVVQQDASIQTDHPYPETPESSQAEAREQNGS